MLCRKFELILIITCHPSLPLPLSPFFEVTKKLCTYIHLLPIAGKTNEGRKKEYVTKRCSGGGVDNERTSW